MRSQFRLFIRFAVAASMALGLNGAGSAEPQAGVAPAPPKTKTKVAVMAHSDFVPDRVKPQQGQLIGLPDVLADRIVEHLSNSRRFTLIDRTALRRVVLEQRFGGKLEKTYLDRTLDKAIDAMEDVQGGGVAVLPDGASPPGRVRAAAGTVGTTGALADYNDLVKDFQDLGGALGADYLVLGNLEKLARSSRETAVPYSTSGRTQRKDLVDARLRLRVIDVKTGGIAGATSIRTKLSETVFEGRESDTDEFSFFDHLGRLAAAKVLDVTFPARLVSVDPPVISRGVNDGVQKGDVYLIEREGKEIKDASGLVIARLKSEIGRVEVLTPQETVAIVRPLAGEQFQEGDLASLDTSASGDTPQVASAAAVPLGAAPAARSAGAGLPRIAVGLVKSGSTAKTGKAAQEHVPLFTDTMISRLAQTKRFKLIDRQEVDQLLNEQLAQAMTENRDMPSAMGTLKGADYLVYGSLASFSIEEQTVRLPNSSRSFRQVTGHVEGNMRIVDARSGDIMESRKISVEEAVDPQAGANRVVTLLADAYADQVVLMLMNAIYPIKVAHVGADGVVYINRGNDGGLSVGETLDAYRPGEAIVDPDTGVQLGVEETAIGQVRVTEVEDARSKGSLIGEGRLSTGDLLKRAPQNRAKRASVAARESASAPQRTGGQLGAPRGGGAAGAESKATIAVGLLKVTPGAHTSRLTAGAVKRLTDELILKLSDSNRFVVMERQEVDQVLDEKTFEALAKGGDIRDRLQQLVGADYLVHGEIINYYIDTHRKKVPYVNEVRTTATAVAEGIFRVVDVHTGAVSGGTKANVVLNYPNVQDETLVFNELRDQFTTEAVASIVARLYPIKVLGMGADGIVYLNRGADAGLARGAQFDVMRPGEELIDPDTGRSFGRAETTVAALEIVAVEANRSRARLVSGAEARSGDILRKPQVVARPPEPPKLQPAW